jgi:hypothetical protein
MADYQAETTQVYSCYNYNFAATGSCAEGMGCKRLVLHPQADKIYASLHSDSSGCEERAYKVVISYYICIILQAS